MRVLIPVDGSDAALRGVHHAVKFLSSSGGQAPTEVHLLNVQPPLRGSVGMFLSGDDVEDYHREEGFKVIEPARSVIEQAGLACTPHIAVGTPGEVIDRFAQDLHADLIIMGTRGLGNIADMVLGSTSEEVLRATNVPVLLVK